MRSNHTTAAQTDRPHTTADAANATIRQLLELRAGQHVELVLTGDSQLPDFHEEGTVYHVAETRRLQVARPTPVQSRGRHRRR